MLCVVGKSLMMLMLQPPSSIALQRLSSSLDGFKSLTPSYRRKISEQTRAA